jgi:putative transposase
MLPERFPPHQTTYRWFMRFRDDGTWKSLNHHLVMRDRERSGREAGPSAAVIDTQSVKTTEAGGPRGYDAGKKIKGRKRHAMVDTDGRCLEMQVQEASVQDRDGAPTVLQASQARFPFVRTVFADSVYAGEKVATATSIVVEIVRELPDQVGFQVLPRRWVVERFFAWINRNRRLAKDFEATIASATAFLYAACVMLLIQWEFPRLCRGGIQSLTFAGVVPGCPSTKLRHYVAPATALDVRSRLGHVPYMFMLWVAFMAQHLCGRPPVSTVN